MYVDEIKRKFLIKILSTMTKAYIVLLGRLKTQIKRRINSNINVVDRV